HGFRHGARSLESKRARQRGWQGFGNGQFARRGAVADSSDKLNHHFSVSLQKQIITTNSMKIKLLILAFSAMLTAQLCCAQATTSGDDAKPASSNVPGQDYPKIHSDLRVDFRLKAPDAQKVRLHLDKDYDLERGSNGVWTMTTTPQ